MTDYFSDRELGPRARIESDLTPQVWAGIVALVNGLVNSGAFGAKFPDRCPDGQAICGCDVDGLGAAVQAHVPGLSWPLEATRLDEEALISCRVPYAPHTMLALDFVEFVWQIVAKPVLGCHHDFFRHHHLTFEVQAGREEFRDQVNTIFARNGLAYEMGANGRISRLLPAIIGDAMRRPMVPTGDKLLDVMLEEARIKFSDIDPLVRREALERLWDSFERIKSSADDDKKQSIKVILERTAPQEAFRKILDSEASALTAPHYTQLLVAGAPQKVVYGQ